MFGTAQLVLSNHHSFPGFLNTYVSSSENARHYQEVNQNIFTLFVEAIFQG